MSKRANKPPVPKFAERWWRKRTKPYAIHRGPNPPGSKFLRRCFKHKFGRRAPYPVALKWYLELV